MQVASEPGLPPSTSASTSAQSPPNRASTSLGLSCRECQRKKIKCDRRYPCAACSRAGLPCIPSARKPRAKIGAKAVDAELRQRLAKLEQLVEEMKHSDGPDPDQTPEGHPPGMPSSADDPTQTSYYARENASSSSPEARGQLEANSPAAAKYVAASFWNSLTAEVQALRGVFEDDGFQSDDDAESADASPLSSGPIQPQPVSNPTDGGFELFFCPPGELYVMPGALNEPDAFTSGTLINAYLDNAEHLYKNLHIPTFQALQEGQPYLGQPASAPCNKALVSAVQFGGAMALTNEECNFLLGRPKDQVVRQCRSAVDIWICKADPLNTNDIALMQALSIYVYAVRIVDPSRRAWSLTGLLVRIARAMYLHKEIPDQSVLVTELRRRVWYNMIFLDAYSIFDRGTDPLIDINSFSTELPSNINDADICESTTSLPVRTGELTDMTFARVMCEASTMMLRMGSLSARDITWQQRLQQAHEFQLMVQTEFVPLCRLDNPKQAHWVEIADATTLAVILRAVRPVEIHLVSSQPSVDSPWVLEIAVNILRYANQTGKFSRKTPWRRMPWVPWHAISVTLAALCSIRDTPLADEAWMLVERAMSRYGDDIADSARGMLWRPITRIYRKALRYRNSSPTGPPSAAPSTTTSADTLPLSATFSPEQHFAFQNSGIMPGAYANANVPPVSMPLLPPGALPVMPGGMPPNPNEPLVAYGYDLQGSLRSAAQDDLSWMDWEIMMRDIDQANTKFSMNT